MKIGITTNGDNIICIKDYSNIDQKGQISHFLAELELIKFDLLELWREWNNWEDTEKNMSSGGEEDV